MEKNKLSDTISEPLEESLVRLLKKHQLSIAVAESCTGGLLAGRIVNVSGVSQFFKAGFVTYTEEAKQRILHVSRETLQRETAVSAQTAREMALGAAGNIEADVSISTTGLAGPLGGTPEKPVGLVYIATYLKGKILVKEYHFKGNRSKIREEAVIAALEQTKEFILEVYGEEKNK